jgi:hypothetical protein
MQIRRVIRYLRIAATVLSLTACVLVIALWVRGYWWADNAVSQPSTLLRQFGFISKRGRLTFIVSQRNPRARAGVYFPKRWRIDSDSLSRTTRHTAVPPRRMWVYEVDKRAGRLIVIPHWSTVLLFGTLASCLWLPWFKWRFSMRTLLIVTALVAVAMGIVVAI